MLFKPCDFYHFVRLFSIKIINNNNDIYLSTHFRLRFFGNLMVQDRKV